MDKYQRYLEEHKEDALLDTLFEQVKEREFDKAYGTAMRLQAIRDIKWELKKIETEE